MTSLPFCPHKWPESLDKESRAAPYLQPITAERTEKLHRQPHGLPYTRLSRQPILTSIKQIVGRTGTMFLQ